MTRRALALAVLVLVAAFPAFSQDRFELPDATRVDIDADAEGTPAWQVTVEERNRQLVEEARETGESSISLQVGKATESAAAGEGPATPVAEEAGTAAAAEQTTPGYQHQEPDPFIHEPSRIVGDAGLPPGQDLSDLIAILIEEWSRPPQIVALSYNAATARADTEPPPPAAALPPPVTLAIEAGRPLYARTLYEVNSDFPGPVLLEILEPPLAGAVATGSFTRVRDSMVLRLSRIETGGVSHAIDGWAVGLDCACFGISGEVDRHWLDRVIMPAAIAFVEGWSRALARPSTTVNVEGGLVVQSTAEATAEERIYEGIAAATGPAAAVLTEDAPREMTVRIPRNTELAITFTTAPGIAGIGAGGNP